jgi:hypothetical protein
LEAYWKMSLKKYFNHFIREPEGAAGYLETLLQCTIRSGEWTSASCLESLTPDLLAPYISEIADLITAPQHPHTWKDEAGTPPNALGLFTLAEVFAKQPVSIIEQYPKVICLVAYRSPCHNYRL